MQYDLSRYITAQEISYPRALSEIRAGRKRTHWMWYIFPQIRGLGVSATSQKYAIGSLEEAKAFLAQPYLRGNLLEISNALLALETSDPGAVFPWPDNLKLKSSMTLFALAGEGEARAVFLAVLEKFYGGEQDAKTLEIVNLL